MQLLPLAIPHDFLLQELTLQLVATILLAFQLGAELLENAANISMFDECNDEYKMIYLPQYLLTVLGRLASHQQHFSFLIPFPLSLNVLAVN